MEFPLSRAGAGRRFGRALAPVLDSLSYPVLVEALVEVQALENEFDDRGCHRRRRLRLDLGDMPGHSLDLLDDALVVRGRHHVADLDGDARLEAGHDVIEIGDAEVA